MLYWYGGLNEVGGGEARETFHKLHYYLVSISPYSVSIRNYPKFWTIVTPYPGILVNIDT